MANTSENLRFPKDVRIDEIFFISSTGEAFDLRNVFVELNLYEDIYNNTMSGDILIEDALNIPSNAPIIGNERIYFKFYTPVVNATPIEFRGTIYKISDRMFVNDKRQTYMLHFTSDETVRSALTTISKSYSGKISEIMESIVTGKQVLIS